MAWGGAAGGEENAQAWLAGFLQACKIPGLSPSSQNRNEQRANFLA